jgi:hypothetical protein
VPQALQVGVVVDVQEPLMKDPAAHEVMQLWHAVCAPAALAKVPTEQALHTGVAVDVHVPLRNWPAAQVVTHVLQAVCAPAAS